ncbi:4'-phosphopantetheinyl transferase family protein [Paenibacillus albidus]|uniref:4'-phosphopantetheinyl transferase family protein n=1 Tax=Paenibacillus albidus TaxID=2041023 RepID=UPI003570A5E3
MKKPETDQKTFFSILWTLKESYIKAKGMGLSLPLNSFSFTFHSDQSIALSPIEEGYFFRQYELDYGYKLSACSSADEFLIR